MVVGAGMLVAHDLPPIRLGTEATPLFCESGMINTMSIRDVGIRNVNVRAERWTWQILPDGFIYHNYLAATQNRLGGLLNYDPDIKWNADVTLGGRAPLLRYGNKSALFPEGWQLDLEGSAHLRLGLMEQMDMEANDFRAGLPLSYGTKIWQVRTGYYHISSHTGDERILRYRYTGEPQFDPRENRYKDEGPHRLNYVREAWLLSYSYRPTPNTRLYAEVDYAFWKGERTKPWHFQFGAEYSPLYPARGGWGTPFAAINVRLMQEHDFDGNLTLQTGWQWRGSRNELFRIGFQYFTGASEQYTFLYHPREHKVGFGVWYDF
jgi:hypothetical protein